MDHDTSDSAPQPSDDHNDLIELVEDPTPAADNPGSVVEDDHLCMTCSYSLRGLARSGQCPECGTPVSESLRGNLLFYRNVDYTRTLLKGVSFVLNGILLQIVFVILGSFLLGILAATGVIPASNALFQFLIPAISTAISAMILLGWWWFTSQDPGVSTELEPKARRVVRGAVIASFALTLLALIGQFLPATAVNAATGAAGFGAREIILGLVGLGSLVAMATQFFAGMLYVRGLAQRLPNEKIYKRAKSRMIACPLWYTVGALILIGPLIALVLYWNLLDMVRKALKTIIRAQEAGAQTPPVIHIK